LTNIGKYRNILLVRWQEVALLVLPKGRLCEVGAKPNVPLVRLAKIELKKCAVGKIKNTEG